MNRLKVGDLISSNGHKCIVLKVGRSQGYSIVVKGEKDSRPCFIITEVPFYMNLGTIKFLNNKPANVKWAKEYAKNNLLPEV